MRHATADDPTRLLDTVVEAHGAPFMTRVAAAGVATRDSEPAWRVDVLMRILRLCRPGDTVLETGSGIGAHALPIVRALGPDGRLYAYEANERTRRLLMHNLAVQRIDNVTLLGDVAIDALALARLDGLKLGDSASVAQVLDAGEATLWRARPWILAACVDDDLLARKLAEFGYRGWRVAAPAGAERHVLAFPEESDLAAAPDACVEWP